MYHEVNSIYLNWLADNIGQPGFSPCIVLGKEPNREKEKAIKAVLSSLQKRLAQGKESFI